MKKIINGKTYNTETSEYICGYYNWKPWNDFDAFDTSLYRTKKSNFFKVERTYFKTEFEPISEKEAKKYIEKYGNAEDYIKCFGEPEEA